MYILDFFDMYWQIFDNNKEPQQFCYKFCSNVIVSTQLMQTPCHFIIFYRLVIGWKSC